MPNYKKLLLATLALVTPAAANAGQRCQPQYSTKYLCVLPSADMSRVHESPEVLQAAQVVAMKLHPYLPPDAPIVNLTMGYRSPAEQERIRRTGVRAGPSSGKFVSAHIYGVALDVEVDSKKNLGKEMCAALNQIMPMLKNKGGVIMEGSGGGSTNGHIDDNWGARFSMEKYGVKKTLNYTGNAECTETYGVSGPSAELYKDMAKITVDSLEKNTASTEEDDMNDPKANDDTGEPPVAAAKPAKNGKRAPSSWQNNH